MAGDYIPMSTGLRQRREVGILAREMAWSLRETIGSLYDFWTWAQDETADGKLHGLTIDDVAKLTTIDARFFHVLMTPEVGWLAEKGGLLLIPRFTRWMGKGAKKRLKERDKKRRQRAPGRPRSVPKVSPSQGDKPGTKAGLQDSTGTVQKETEPGAAGTASPSFEEFWALYPNHDGKVDAERAWEKLAPTPELWAAMRPALEQQRASPRWQKDGGTYVPLAVNWLRGRRWEDPGQLALVERKPPRRITYRCRKCHQPHIQVDDAPRVCSGTWDA